MGIANEGILNTYGLSFADIHPSSAEDLSLPEGALVLPANGSLVKSQEDQTVYLISQGQRYGFISANVFTSLAFKFSSVLVVTNPELQALPYTSNLENPASQHQDGTDISYRELFTGYTQAKDIPTLQ